MPTARVMQKYRTGSWKVSDGPLRRNNNHIGSTYDARYVIPGWDLPGFDDGRWRSVQVVTGPGGELVSQEQPPIRAGKSIRPLSIRRMGTGYIHSGYG